MTAVIQEERILESVGTGGSNQEGDVRLIQDLLNRATSAGLAVDGDCGPRTREAILSFQKGVIRNPDGRIDPDGVSFRTLVKRSREQAGAPKHTPAEAAGPTDGLRLQQLPTSGRGYYSYSTANKQYGTEAMIQVLVAVGKDLADKGFLVGIGDISYPQGGDMPPHKTHRAGKHVDLRPVRSDGDRGPTQVGATTYSQEGTRALVKSLLAQSEVKKILFNDGEIEGVRSFPGHHNHLHVELR